MKRRAIVVTASILIIGLWSFVASMDEGDDRDPQDLSLFQFARIQYNGYMLGGWRGGGFVPPWAHDYPQAEENFLRILSELTTVETTPQSYRVLRFHDREIMDYPMLYVSEPGFWDATDAEVENVRKYLDRGGFILFDDFRGRQEWNNLVYAMKRVYPERNFRQLTVDEPIFQCFYNIESLDLPSPYPVQGEPEFWGIDDGDGRLQVIACRNNDIGDYWEWSMDQLTPIELSNEAYKFGINFVIYAMTH